MSRIKELKSMPENQINVIDILSLIVSDQKSKYMDTLIRIMKKTPNINEYIYKIKSDLNERYEIPLKTLNEIPDFQVIFIYKFIDSMFYPEDIINFKKFCDFNERNLISKNDLSKYSSFEEIKKEVSLVELKLESKELENQVIKIFEDNEWVIVRPLTYNASKKYGSNTKWCTTSENEYSYFRKYATNGILIYIINKDNGLKVAFYKSLNDENDNEFSFWNQLDKKIDSLQSELPFEILKIISDEIKLNPITNRSYLTESDVEKDDILNGYGKKRRDKTFISAFNTVGEQAETFDFNSEVSNRETETIGFGEEDVTENSESPQIQSEFLDNAL